MINEIQNISIDFSDHIRYKQNYEKVLNIEEWYKNGVQTIEYENLSDNKDTIICKNNK